ncbi:MAG TPA: nuclear transport factor 2 family protein [Candidatus Polarisedimenticolaceae bacterium]|nr:nuclear transport factor 2 family protein [Candidatus Polarisedimenticolaceae bacterium]
MRLALVLAAALFPAGPFFATDQADVMAVAQKFVDGFNSGDTKSALATCAENAMIIDEFPPHAWTGCGAWAAAYDADAKKNGISDGVVTLGKPKHVDVSGDRAYAVFQADYAYKQKGKSIMESGSIYTFAFQKSPSGWRIVGWTWAKY